MIPYSRHKKNISSMTNSRSHTCHIIPPFGFCLPTHVGAGPADPPPQSSFSRLSNIQSTVYVSLLHREKWAIANKKLHILSELVGLPSCDTQQLGDLSLTLSLYIDPESSFNSIISFSHAPQFSWKIRSIADFILDDFIPADSRTQWT